MKQNYRHDIVYLVEMIHLQHAKVSIVLKYFRQLFEMKAWHCATLLLNQKSHVLLLCCGVNFGLCRGNSTKVLEICCILSWA